MFVVALAYIVYVNELLQKQSYLLYVDNSSPNIVI